MKNFNLFLGTSGAVGTYNVTADSDWLLAAEAVTQLRNRILSEDRLRLPFLRLFISLHNDNTDFPDDPKDCTPIADQTKINQIRNRLPTDADVVEFFTNAFPDIYLVPGEPFSNEVDCERDRTLSDRGKAEKKEIAIVRGLVQLWYQSVSIVDV